MSTQRQILLCRHAHADPGTDDPARALSAIGQAQARRAGDWLSQNLNTPIKLLCSPSVRTQQSADLLAEKLVITSRANVEGIYEGSVATLLEVLDTHSGDVMLVGHNPGFEALLAFLCTGQSGSFRGMSPGSIAWMSLQSGDLSPGSARLQHFHSA